MRLRHRLKNKDKNGPVVLDRMTKERAGILAQAAGVIKIPCSRIAFYGKSMYITFLKLN